MTDYKDWTRYHIIHVHGNKWKFYREGMKRSIKTGGRQDVIREALYKVCFDGGYLCIHKTDGSVDFVVDNWSG